MKKVKVNCYQFECEVNRSQALEWKNTTEKTIFVCDTFDVSCDSLAFERIEMALESLLTKKEKLQALRSY